MRVELTASGADSLFIEQGPTWRIAAIFLGAVVMWGGALVLFDHPVVVLIWCLGGAWALSFAAVGTKRALTPVRHSLQRSGGRLLLDGETVELARVELRVTRFPITGIPTGYDLSLWVMLATGSLAIPLGHFPSLLRASQVSGVMEEFVQRAAVKHAGHRA